ncbi:MAG: glycosyltransferase [Candidatus Sericytochromatia bacterium]
MNILILSAWYPTHTTPLSGIFVHEQSQALANLRPDWHLAVSVAETRILSLRAPHSFWPRSWPKPSQIYKNRLLELRAPVLQWTHRWQLGNIAGILKLHRSHLQNLQEQWGKIDLIHAHVGWPAGWVAWKLSQEFHIPFVITEHMSPFPFRRSHLLTRTKQLSPLLKEPMQNCDALIAVSPSLVKTMREFGLPHAVYVPNSIDESRFFPIARIPQPVTTFASLSLLRAKKGIPDLLQAIAQMPLAEFPCHFRIGGTGPELHAYQSQAQQLGISHFIEWCGEIPHRDVPAFMQACDVFVLPSHNETFGVVLAEALACGKPLISTYCGGPEVIITPQNGLLVQPHQPAELAEAMLWMCQHHRRFDPQTLHADFLERFARPAVVDQLEAIYSTCIEDFKSRSTRTC